MPRVSSSTADDADSNKALKLVNWIIDRAIDGIPPLCSAKDLALEYQIDQSYPDDEERIEALINWETAKNFTSGFITGLGGLLITPVSIPAALGSSWIIQARMSAAIAIISGHNIQNDRVRTFVLITLLGDAAKEVLKEAGIKVATKFSAKILEKIPGKVLIEINKKIGFRLLTKAGTRGVVNLTRMLPIAGGVVGGTFDAAACRIVGKTAKRIFCPEGTTK